MTLRCLILRIQIHRPHIHLKIRNNFSFAIRPFLLLNILLVVRCQTKVHNCKCSYLLWYFLVLLSKILLLIEFCFIISLIFLIFSPCPKYTSLCVRLSNDSWNDFRQARKLQTFCGMICGRPASTKTFKKWVAGGPQAQNPLKSDLREARKHQIL